MREGKERRERLEKKDRAREVGAPERALSDPVSASPSSGSSRNELKRPRTMSARLNQAAQQV